MPHVKAIEIFSLPSHSPDKFQIEIRNIQSGVAPLIKIETTREELMNIINFFESINKNYLPTLDLLPKEVTAKSSFSTGI